MFAAPLSITTTDRAPLANAALGTSKRYKPGMFVASISTKPPLLYAPVTVCVASVIATRAAPGRTYDATKLPVLNASPVSPAPVVTELS